MAGSRGEEGAARSDGKTEEEAEAEDPTLLVLGERSRGAPSTTREMLQRAARDARDERDRIGEPVMVINDENLGEHADGGRVSLGLADPPPLEDAGSVPDELAEKERFWRTKVLEIRQRWREAYESIEPLEAEAARLRTRFYSEDDPVRRDREIKPQWDRTLDRLAEAERTMTTAGEELAIAFEQGRRDGALPGWLREGDELGPFDFEDPAEGESLDELSPSEPTVVEAQSLEPPF
ncbi:MAG TPA: hypothetical protein VMT85_20230 [Thermoanaerobaculia bacterium]|nr:hypothetical protein [Thermoanaerobaculia bacterium]